LDGVSEKVLARAFQYWKNIDQEIGERIEQAVGATVGAWTLSRQARADRSGRPSPGWRPRSDVNGSGRRRLLGDVTGRL
jgi:hypothetical protein